MTDDQTKDVKFDAYLMEWDLCETRDAKGAWWPVLLGDVWSDRRGRWSDGTRIRTAVIRSMPEGPLRFGDIIETRNSVYVLGRPIGATIQ